MSWVLVKQRYYVSSKFEYVKEVVKFENDVLG